MRRWQLLERSDGALHHVLFISGSLDILTDTVYRIITLERHEKDITSPLLCV